MNKGESKDKKKRNNPMIERLITLEGKVEGFKKDVCGDQKKIIARLEEIWHWISGDGDEGAGEILRKHAREIVEIRKELNQSSAQKQSLRRIIIDKGIWGGIALGLFILDALIFYKLGG